MKATNTPNLSARPDADVARMLERAKKDGKVISKVINSALRDWCHKEGYARKKDLTC